MQKNNFFCDVCNINIQTAAEHALHAFSKKHCTNLMRIAKNKKVPKKEKAKVSEEPPPTEEPKQISVAPAFLPPETVANYGYFVPSRIYETGVESRGYKTGYDPYNRKYATNPKNETFQNPSVRPMLTSDGKSGGAKKKKKKPRTCQICNITLLSLPEYEAHLISPQHILSLKVSGMGVSAHFIKSNMDLHTIKTEEECNVQSESSKSAMKSVAGTNSASAFPMLYCDVCELILNSEQQFNAHVKGRSHNDNVQRKAEIKAQKQFFENPTQNQLYCFSCKVALNNLYQYNEHKYGKKHQIKCNRLMRMGITIPPEERVESWGMPRLDPNKTVVYPELYEKFILEKDRNKNSFETREEGSSVNINPDSVKNLVNEKPEKFSGSESKSEIDEEEVEVISEKNIKSMNNYSPEKMSLDGGVTNDVVLTSGEPHRKNVHCIIVTNDVLKCNVCALDFMQQKDFDNHLTNEDHARNVVELKRKGMKDDEILNNLLNDKNVVKPDEFGRYLCSTCSITAGNGEEFAHHISTAVHKQCEEDYKRKRKIEIKFAVMPDEYGLYKCRKCQESSDSLVEYNRHLRTAAHEVKRAEKTKKVKVSFLRRLKQKYIISGLKRKDFACWRKKCEENPGVRTKPLTPGACLHPGNPEPIPDSEKLKPKIEIESDSGILNQGAKRKTDNQGNIMKEMKRTKPNREEFNFQPLMPRLYPPRPPPHLYRHSRPMLHRNWPSYPQQHPYGPISYPQRPIFPINRYQRPPFFNPLWPRYPSCYN